VDIRPGSLVQNIVEVMPEQLGERRPGRPGEQDAEQVDAGVVQPSLARLEGQWKLGDPGKELVAGQRGRQRRGEDPAFDHRRLQRRRLHHRAPA
jgi:hypothetical protein